MKIIQSKFVDFCEFARLQLASTDIDPVYPVLRAAYAGAPKEIALWRTLLYVAYYHLGSAERAWTRWPVPEIVPGGEVAIDQTGIERRGFRGNDRAADFINSALALVKRRSGRDRIEDWISMTVQNGGKSGWTRVRDEFELIDQAGPWASYKWADLLASVHGYPITAPDIGVGGNVRSSGPVSGLVALTGLDWKVCAVDTEFQQRLLEKCQDAFVAFTGIEQLETALCDFNSLVCGRYYVGHDIDQMMTQIPESTRLWSCRRAAIPMQYLGEYHGWFGVKPKLKTVYRDKRLIVTTALGA